MFPQRIIIPMRKWGKRKEIGKGKEGSRKERGKKKGKRKGGKGRLT